MVHLPGGWKVLLYFSFSAALAYAEFAEEHEAYEIELQLENPN